MFFHIHIYYTKSTRHIAEEIRKNVIESFPQIYVSDLVDKEVGPHTKPMFLLTIKDSDLIFMIPWIMLNRKSLSVLIHPNYNESLLDHTERAMWLGEKLDLNLESLKEKKRQV